MNNRAAFTQPVSGPILCDMFTIKMDDGWYLVRRTPNECHCEPIDGWHVLKWRLWVNLRAIWRGMGTAGF
ncbi:hypothetical protein PBI_NEBKISS_46 [Mycobacterium phage Nebkiss]|nr:hypothetical protein PBI_NEBKISS_46 [Mycobacterium phage Nebkiss]